MRRQSSLLVWVALALACCLPLGKALAESLVRVRVFSQLVDERAPWVLQPVQEGKFIGLVVGEQEILVSGIAAQSAQYLEIERLDSAERVGAKLVRVDYNAQLALIKADKVLEGLKPLSLGSDIALGTRVKILTLKDKSIVPIRSTFRELKIRSSLTAPYNLPQMAFQVKQSHVGWSEPILYQKKLVGLAIRKERQQIFALPISVIRRFLEGEGSQSSFGRLGLRYSALRSKLLRSELGLTEANRGVWVSEVSQGSPLWGKVQKGDVLLKIDRFPISEQGLIRHPKWGKIPLGGIVYKYPAGQQISFRMLRGGKTQTLTTEMKPFDAAREFIPQYSKQERQYLIYAGLLFIQLSQNYLGSYGKEWARRAPLLLLNRFYYGNRSEPKQQARGFVILSKVFVDEANKGYEGLRNLEVQTVNGIQVRSIEDLKLAFGKPELKNGEAFTRIGLGPMPQELVTRHQDIGAVHQRIAKIYSIPSSAFWTAPK